MKTSGSSYAAYMRCPLRWCYEYVDGRVSRITAVPLTVGKQLHKAFENHFTTGRPLSLCLEDIIADTNPADYDTREKDAYSYLAELVEPLAFWKELFPVDATLEIEEPYEFELPNGVTYQMTPDRVIVVWNKIVHMQHKSIDKSKSIGKFVKSARRSVHEHMYGLGLALKYPDIPYGGTIYNVVRKLKYRTSRRTKAEEAADLPGKIINQSGALFFQTPIGVKKELQYQTLDDVMAISEQMKRTADDYLAGRHVPSSHDLDMGIYGNSEDPYLPVLLGEASLDDDTLYMPREERYAMEERKLHD